MMKPEGIKVDLEEIKSFLKVIEDFAKAWRKEADQAKFPDMKIIANNRAEAYELVASILAARVQDWEIP